MVSIHCHRVVALPVNAIHPRGSPSRSSSVPTLRIPPSLLDSQEAHRNRFASNACRSRYRFATRQPSWNGNTLHRRKRYNRVGAGRKQTPVSSRNQPVDRILSKFPMLPTVANPATTSDPQGMPTKSLRSVSRTHQSRSADDSPDQRSRLANLLSPGSNQVENQKTQIR